MTLTDERREELRLAAALEREWEQMLKTHVCAECGAPLVMPHDPEKGGRILACGQDRSHHGFRTKGKTRHVGQGLFEWTGPGFAAPPISALRYVDTLYDRQMVLILESTAKGSDERRERAGELQTIASSWQGYNLSPDREWPPPAKTPREWRAIFEETGQQQVWDCFVRQQAEKGVGSMHSTELAVMPVEKMLQRMEGVKFPQDMTPVQREMLAEAAITYQLDPVMNELMLFQGNLFVSIDGRYRKAQETGNLAGVETRPATQEERTAWGIGDDDYFFRSEVYVKGVERAFVGWGRVRAVETKAPADPRKRGFRPLETNPQRMAEKRAEAQALRKAFHIPLPSAETIGEEAYPDAIDTEAREFPPDDETKPPYDEPSEAEEQEAEQAIEDESEHGKRLPEVDEETGEMLEPPSDDAPNRPPDNLKMDSLGDLFNACHEYFGTTKADVLKLLNVRDTSEIADVKDAWATVCAHKLEPEDNGD